MACWRWVLTGSLLQQVVAQRRSACTRNAGEVLRCNGKTPSKQFGLERPHYTWSSSPRAGRSGMSADDMDIQT